MPANRRRPRRFLANHLKRKHDHFSDRGLVINDWYSAVHWQPSIKADTIMGLYDFVKA